MPVLTVCGEHGIWTLRSEGPRRSGSQGVGTNSYCPSFGPVSFQVSPAEGQGFEEGWRHLAVNSDLLSVEFP